MNTACPMSIWWNLYSLCYTTLLASKRCSLELTWCGWVKSIRCLLFACLILVWSPLQMISGQFLMMFKDEKPSKEKILGKSFSRLGAHSDLRTAGSFHQQGLAPMTVLSRKLPDSSESPLVSSLLIWDSTHHRLNRAYHSEDRAYLCLSLPFSLVHSHFLTPEKHWFSLGLSKFSLNKCSKNKGVTSVKVSPLFTYAMTSVLVVFQNPWVCASFELFWLCFFKNFLLQNNIKHIENISNLLY